MVLRIVMHPHCWGVCARHSSSFQMKLRKRFARPTKCSGRVDGFSRNSVTSRGCPNYDSDEKGEMRNEERPVRPRRNCFVLRLKHGGGPAADRSRGPAASATACAHAPARGTGG